MTLFPHVTIHCLLVYGVLISRRQTEALDPSAVTTVGGTFTVHHSPSQLSLASTAEVIIIPGSDMDTGTSNITGRYSCGDYSATFAATATPREVRVSVSLTGIVGSGDNPSCTIYMGDGNDVTISGGSGSDTHVFAEYGVYKVILECSSDLGTVFCPAQDDSCVVSSDFFDDSHVTFAAPLKYFSTENIQINSFMELTPGCGPPGIVWRFTKVDADSMIVFDNFTQPQSSVLALDAGALGPGEYAVHLETLFPDMGNQYWSEDSMVIRVLYSELVAHIYGGDDRTVAKGTVITVDASRSFDPAGNLSEPLQHEWSFARVSSVSQAFLKFQTKFPFSAFPSGAFKYNINPGTDYLLQVDTSNLAANTICFVVFSLIRGSRKSSALQVLRIKDSVPPLFIECVYNCNLFRENKFNKDRIELDTSLPQEITDLPNVEYVWSLQKWSVTWGIYYWSDIAAPETSTGLTTRSIGILESELQSGETYRIRVKVTAPGYATAAASLIGTINYLPYDGTCTMSTLVGIAARDWFVLTCSGWMGSDDRWTKSATTDTNPYLTFVVRQYTKDAFVEEEPILQTRASKSHLILKLGDPNNSYQTTITVMITDIYQNFIEIPIVATANPAFAWYNVNASDYGAGLIMQYTEVDYVYDELQLRYMGKIDLIIPLVSSVCSHMHLISLPIWTPPVPRVLNQDNSILDLNPSGNSDVGDLGQVLADSVPPPPDNATLTLMEVMQNMTDVVRDMVNTFIVNGSRGSDKLLLSMIINAFTNLAAKDQYANNVTRDNLIYLGELIGVTALKPVENSAADQSAQIERTSGEIHNMSQAIVNTVVPNNLKQARIIHGFLNSKKQIDDMLSVTGDGIDVSSADLSPGERSYLFKKMQGNLRLELNTRQKEAKKAADMARRLALEVLDKLKVCKTCSNEDTTTTKQLVKKNNADVIKADVSRMDHAQFRVDGMTDALGNGSVTTDTSLSAVEFKENVFMYDTDTRSSYVTSNVLHIDVKASSNFVSPPFFTYGQTAEVQPELITPVIDPEDASEFSPHRFIYQSISDYVCIVVKPEDETKVTEYKIYINFRLAPTVLDYDMLFIVNQETFWKVCIEPNQMQGHQGVVYMGVQVPAAVVTVKYYFTLVTAGCLTWEEATTTWHIDKCEMTWVPDFNKINCFCRNLTELTVANSFFVAPNTIDFSSVFLKFSPLNQAAVMGALGCLFLIYIIAVIIVIGLDRRDKLKWGITPLRDNIYGHSHYYIIKVFTGMRRGAGTSSRIAFNLYGDKAVTGPRELFDGVRQHFSTGSVMTLFMATKDDLGTPKFLNIWHDNSGEDQLASWYLNGVAVYDIATNETYTFVAERWLSIETTMDIMLEASNANKPPEFENRFFRQTRDRLSESHMWVSILYRPMTSTFTRVQRASCALVYICLAMIANAMYFNPDPDYTTPPLIQVGPFRFTGQQIFISMICALVTTPVVMFLIFLFKRTKPWPRKSSNDGSGCCGCCQCTCAHACGRLHHYLFHTQKKERRRQYEAALQKRLLSKDVPDIEGGFRLHHWSIFVAWFLVLAGTIVPAFFIMLYSMEWGKQKSEEWLTSFLLSVFQSMIFVDPLMRARNKHKRLGNMYLSYCEVVICLSFVFACLCRKVNEPLTVDTETLIVNYKRWMGEFTTNEDEICDSLLLLKSIQSDYQDHQVLPRNVTKTLHGTDLMRAAEEHRHQQQLSAMLRDILLNFFVMVVVFCICYSNRDDLSYYHHRELKNNVIEPFKLPHFHKIKTPGNLFQWLNRTVIPYLFPEVDWDDRPLPWATQQYTSGLYNFRLGPPRLRQLRILNDTCDVPYIGKTLCYGEYGLFDEDDREFCVGWTDSPCSLGITVASPTLSAWKHVTGREVWGLPIPGELATYSGGGYMAAMYINRNDSIDILNELYEMLWLGRQTRAVFLEFTLYCAETNIFIYNMFLTEFPQTGGAFTTHSVYPMRLYTHQGPTGTFTLICEVIFVIFIIVLIVKICIRFYQQRCGYFKKFWQVYELLMLLIGLTAIVMFAFRLLFTNLTIEKFKEDSTIFVNFSHIAFWDQMFVIFMAILTFMATLRFLEVFSTSKKVSAIVKIFKDCGGDLFWFGTTFFYIILGFCGFAFLLFGAHRYSYMNIYMSLRSLFLALLGKSYFAELNAIKPILAKLFLVLYVMAILFFVMTIFMSILGGSIDSVMHDTREDKREDLMEHLITRFKSLISKPDSKARVQPIDKIPASGNQPHSTEETPATEDQPQSTEETPATEDQPQSTEETPATEDQPQSTEETPATEDQPQSTEETPATGEQSESDS